MHDRVPMPRPGKAECRASSLTLAHTHNEAIRDDCFYTFGDLIDEFRNAVEKVRIVVAGPSTERLVAEYVVCRVEQVDTDALVIFFARELGAEKGSDHVEGVHVASHLDEVTMPSPPACMVREESARCTLPVEVLTLRD